MARLRRPAYVSAAVLYACFALAGPARPASAAVLRRVNAVTQSEQPVPRAIAISVNGARLASSDPAMMLGGRLYVPLRVVAGGLHLRSRRDGPNHALGLPSGETLLVTAGRAQARLGNRNIDLRAPVLLIRGRIYLPVTIFSRALGGVVRYNEASAQLALFVRLQPRPQPVSVAPPLTGTVTAIDADSQPPSVSLLIDDQIRTLVLRAGTPITLEDLVAGTRQSAALGDLHAGDLMTVSFTPDGSVAELTDSYRSRTGVIAAVAPSAIGLADGRVLIPTRSTTITINSAPSGVGGLRVGDAVIVRSNPETLEVREILATRPYADEASGPVRISQMSLVPQRPLRAGEELLVFLRGSAGGRAWFDVGATAVNIPMTELSPGLYRGRYLVAQGASFLHAPVAGHLAIGANAARPMTAAQTFSAATLPPQIVDIAPNEGQTVNDTRAAIYATFSAPTGLEIDPARTRIFVNGGDVSDQAVRTPEFVSYQPANDFVPGLIPVTVIVGDRAGNETTYHWTFTCGSR